MDQHNGIWGKNQEQYLLGKIKFKENGLGKMGGNQFKNLFFALPKICGLKKMSDSRNSCAQKSHPFSETYEKKTFKRKRSSQRRYRNVD